MRKIKVLIACGSGIATSTLIANRVKEIAANAGFDISITQTKVVQVASEAADYDLIVASTEIPSSVKTPYVFALNYLTGINKESTDEEIIEKLKSIKLDDWKENLWKIELN